MNPEDIARMITEDPDVFNEDYCPACGGWDIKQGGRGHNLGCPIGAPDTPINGVGRGEYAKPDIGVLPVVIPNGELWEAEHDPSKPDEPFRLIRKICDRGNIGAATGHDEDEFMHVDSDNRAIMV